VQLDAAHALLARVGLQDVAQADVLGLPYGAKKRLELAMALAGVVDVAGLANASGANRAVVSNASGTPPRARLLLLDEPAAGLAGPERAALMALVKSLAHGAASVQQAASREPAAGMAVLYTEHNMDAVFGVADRVLVLIDGQIAAQGSPHEIAQNDMVRTRYLGRAGVAALSDRAEGGRP
jgi:branched-chain amino acid transport system ATP-binding protein